MAERIRHNTPETEVSSNAAGDYDAPYGSHVIPPREVPPAETIPTRERWSIKKRLMVALGGISLAGLVSTGLITAAIKNYDGKAPETSPPTGDRPTASASAFPSSTAEIAPTTTSVTIETKKTPEAEKFPTTAQGIAERLRLPADINSTDIPVRLVDDLNALFASFDDYDELEPWLGRTANDPAKGPVVGAKALSIVYRQGIEAAYGKNYYSDFVAKEITNAATQVEGWEYDGTADVQKKAVLHPTSINNHLNTPKVKLVDFTFGIDTKGVDAYLNKEAAFKIQADIENGKVKIANEYPPTIVEIPH